MAKEEKKQWSQKFLKNFMILLKLKKIRKSRGKKDNKIMTLEVFDLLKTQRSGKRKKKKINIRIITV